MLILLYLCLLLYLATCFILLVRVSPLPLVGQLKCFPHSPLHTVRTFVSGMGTSTKNLISKYRLSHRAQVISVLLRSSIVKPEFIYNRYAIEYIIKIEHMGFIDIIVLFANNPALLVIKIGVNLIN